MRSAVLDGEIVCLAPDGRSVFNDLLFRRAEPFFCAFDVLWAAGEDLRYLPLYERKHRLRSIIKPQTSRLLYLDHIEERGEDFFQLACAHDLEGIVAKHRYSLYLTDGYETSWIKLKNRAYSQMFGRDELFKRREERAEQMRTTDGWAGCTLVCSEAEM